jgi:hypothetical protein
VFGNKEERNLLKFYDESFNYCFSVDCQMQMQQESTRSHQNDKSISEYTHESQKLFNVIKNILLVVLDRNKAIKFQNRSKLELGPVVQIGFWQVEINPEISPWKQTTAQVESVDTVEISEILAESPDHNLGLSTSQGMGLVTIGHPGGKSRSKGSTPANAARLVLLPSPCTQNRTCLRLGSPFWPRVSPECPHMREESTPPDRGSLHHQMTAPTSRLRSLESQSKVLKSRELEKRTRVLLAELCPITDCARMHRQPVQLLVKIDYPTHATRPIVKSNGSESLGASSFDAEPTMTEFENNTSVLVVVFDSLPTGAT